MKSMEGQKELLFDRREKMRLIRGIAYENLTLRQMQNVKSLLEQIELCTFSDGCKARIEVLAARMNCSRRTVQRIMKLARELSLVHVVEEVNGYGQRPNNYRIVWHVLQKQQRIASERNSVRSQNNGESTAAKQQRIASKKAVTPPRHFVTPPCQNDTHYKKEFNPPINPLINPQLQAADLKIDEGDMDSASGGLKIYRKLLDRGCLRNSEVNKLALLSLLAAIKRIGRTQQIKNPPGFLRYMLKQPREKWQGRILPVDEDAAIKALKNLRQSSRPQRTRSYVSGADDSTEETIGSIISESIGEIATGIPGAA